MGYGWWSSTAVPAGYEVRVEDIERIVQLEQKILQLDERVRELERRLSGDNR
jgi:hypothetical protein